MTIEVDKAGDVAVLTLAHGKANALDTELCRELVAQLENAELNGTRAVVLAGRDGMFSAGVDLKRVSAGGADYVREFLPALSDAFLAVFGFPGPVVAAMTGHAIAGGAVLAAACDRRVLNARQGRVGVTELLVGVPFPLVALEILRCAYGTDRLPGLTFLAETYAGEEALARGLVDELAAPEEVLPRAIETATRLAAVPGDVFRHTKAQIHRPFDERIGEQRAGDDVYVEQVWSSAPALAAIEQYVRAHLGG
ncbi:enoyl-CoA hydratase/isomerase family protein [Amycolatopsis granulosa]|uniref:enoyl-CoA hydratase/isomerase family protein n=1 Tax=Amycolatopsis granulosa TaxID=185684 RepID=UPI00141ED351|nr:enoyl-CoA hydratase/isomerase family protein [Amycolatopsis granulosa]NIH84166.1 enoyl-CoA hydratase [Amycolatopsis granulosa]